MDSSASETQTKPTALVLPYLGHSLNINSRQRMPKSASLWSEPRIFVRAGIGMLVFGSAIASSRRETKWSPPASKNLSVGSLERGIFPEVEKEMALPNTSARTSRYCTSHNCEMLGVYKACQPD